MKNPRLYKAVLGIVLSACASVASAQAPELLPEEIKWFSQLPLEPNKASHDWQVLVKINDGQKMVGNGSRIKIIEGDKITVHDLYDGQKVIPIEKSNFVGFASAEKGNDDRFQEIPTKDLIAKYSKDGQGVEYAMTFENKGKLLGYILFEIEKPKLNFVQLTVNSKKYVLKHKDILKVKTLSKIKIENVNTNFNSKAGLHFKLEEVKTADFDQINARIYRLNFLRSESLIGFFHILVSESVK